MSNSFAVWKPSPVLVALESVSYNGPLFFKDPIDPEEIEETIENINRLFELSFFLRNLAKRADFSMGNWGDLKNSSVGRRLKTATHCKTVACIAGWATRFHPDLEFTGVEYDPKCGDRKGLGDVRYTGTSRGEGLWGSSKGVDILGYDAFTQAFNVAEDLSLEVCTSEAEHRLPKQAAAVVEEVADEMAKAIDIEVKSTLVNVTSRCSV
jgi:hypothetical protein